MTSSIGTRPIFLQENGFYIARQKLLLALGLAYALTLLFSPSASAESRSKTVTVSCIVPAVMEISSAFSQGAPTFSSSQPAPQDQISLSGDRNAVNAGGNMNGKFRLQKQNLQGRQLFTLTAL